MIPGAITRDEYEAAVKSLAGRRVVVYCTVGGRSYLYARKLVATGVEAANYRDGILGWCRVGLPLESPDKNPTNAVHPYWRVFNVPDQYEVRT
jgi:rhodanese-related sulfurtransferase